MSRLSREVLKEQLTQAIFDVLDEMESDIRHDMTTQKEAETIADARAKSVGRRYRATADQ